MLLQIKCDTIDPQSIVYNVTFSLSIAETHLTLSCFSPPTIETAYSRPSLIPSSLLLLFSSSRSQQHCSLPSSHLPSSIIDGNERDPITIRFDSPN